MLQGQQDKLKDALIDLIARHIGQKTADMYCSYYDAQSPSTALTSAENLLAEFIGKEMARDEMEQVRTAFRIPSEVV